MSGCDEIDWVVAAIVWTLNLGVSVANLAVTIRLNRLLRRR